MTRTKKVFVLYNEELGYTDTCPVFMTKEEAEAEAACKCRNHSAQARGIDEFKPCRPNPKYTTKQCEECAIYYKNYKK